MHQVRKPDEVGRLTFRLVYLAFHAPGPQPRSVAEGAFGLARRLDLVQAEPWLAGISRTVEGCVGNDLRL